MDESVFKALGDETRRELLDRLFTADGQTLSELCQGLAGSRQAVTKHLKILEKANLVAVVWEGREKRHFLNAIPIQGVADRWIRKFQVRQVRAINALKSALENGGTVMSDMQYVYETYIRATPERIWEALTSGEFTRQYFHQTTIKSDFAEGSRVVYHNPDGSDGVEGEVLRADPPRRLMISWHPLYQADLAAEEPSRVTFDIEPTGETCRLRVRHDRFPEGSKVLPRISEGWPEIICSLKSLLETGQALPIAGNEAS